MEHVDTVRQPEDRLPLFQPPQDFKGDCPENAEDFCITISEEINLVCRFYLSDPEAPIVIFFHGGGESTDSFDPEAKYFNEVGINILLTSQRGFGKSTGTPSIAALVADAGEQLSQASQWARAKDYKGAFFVMGRSLGSIAAIDAVHKNPDLVKGLILESTFCDTLPPLLDSPLTASQSLKNTQKIAEIKAPTIFFHGSRDSMVPVSQAEKLQAASAAKNKQFLVIPGADHFTVSKNGGKLYFKTIKGFVDTVCGINTWRQRRRKYKTDQEEGGL